MYREEIIQRRPTLKSKTEEAGDAGYAEVNEDKMRRIDPARSKPKRPGLGMPMEIVGSGYCTVV
jgi:hypothetical protein